MSQLIQQIIAKMGLQDEQGVLSKTTELVRLLELRSSNVPVQVNEYGKIVLCADLAAALLGIPIDKEQALKLSGLRKSNYANNYRMFEKLLDLNKLIEVKDICLQLNLLEVNKKATQLLDLYKKVISVDQTDIDLTHPQYAAMAVFQACKLMKIKVSKPKLMPFSNLRPAQWQHLEIKWDQFMEKHYKSFLENKLKNLDLNTLENEENVNPDSNQQTCSGKENTAPMEPYEEWRERMLKMAREDLEKNGDCEEEEEIDENEVILVQLETLKV